MGLKRHSLGFNRSVNGQCTDCISCTGDLFSYANNVEKINFHTQNWTHNQDITLLRCLEEILVINLGTPIYITIGKWNNKKDSLYTYFTVGYKQVKLNFGTSVDVEELTLIKVAFISKDQRPNISPERITALLYRFFTLTADNMLFDAVKTAKKTATR